MISVFHLGTFILAMQDSLYVAVSSPHIVVSVIICRNGVELVNGNIPILLAGIPSDIFFEILRPRNKEELFNLRHAQAWNVIEHIFGVIKKRWVILVLQSKFDMELQAQIPAALAALHNFILDRDPTQAHVNEDVYDPSPGEHLDPEELLQSQGTTADTRLTEEESEEGRQLWDSIAQAMWEQYQQTLSNRDTTVLHDDLSITDDEDMVENEDEMGIGSNDGLDD
jgi:hypothetical protein